jgi:hypothetical protein
MGGGATSLDRSKVYHNLICLWNEGENVPETVEFEAGGFRFAEVETFDCELGIYPIGYFFFAVADSPNKWCASSPDMHHCVKEENGEYTCVHCGLSGECIP